MLAFVIYALKPRMHAKLPSVGWQYSHVAISEEEDMFQSKKFGLITIWM